MFNKNNLWVIVKNNSEMFHFDTPIKEIINTENLDLVLKSGFNKTYTCTEWLEEFKCSFTDVRSHLKKIKANIKNGFLVTYAQVNSYGRASYRGHVSMCSLPCEVRQCLSIGKTKDFDIENAQPKILCEIMRLSGADIGEYTLLLDYCENRSEWIKNLHKSFDKRLPESEVKRFYKKMVIATAFFGGSIKKFKEDNGIESSKNCVRLSLLKDEVEAIMKKHVIGANPNIFASIVLEVDKKYEEKKQVVENEAKRSKKANVGNSKPRKSLYKKNPVSRLAAKFLQNYERIIIETVINKLVERKKMVKNRFIYTYDGFQDESDVTVEEIQQIVKEEIGFDLVFTVKGTEEGEQLMERVNELIHEDKIGKYHPDATLEEFDVKYFTSLHYDYELMKDYWERFFCFTVKDANYWLQDTEKRKDPESGKIKKVRSITPYKWKGLMESFGHIKVIDYIPAKPGRKISERKVMFIQKWRDDGMRVYKQMEFYPENKPLEERLKSQYYNVFAGYSECVFRKSNIDKKTSQKYKTIWESLMTNMLGSREAMIIWNHIVAFKIKHPALNKPFGIIMKGLQGEGKNWSLSRLAKIVGKNHYLTTSKVSDVLGEHVMGMFRKIIVNLDEMDLTSTKSLTNRFKTMISQSEITFNPKHANMFEAINYALLMITTNEQLPVVLDVLTGDRRWFIFEGNGKNCKISESKWAEIWALTDTEEFAQWLYSYYNGIECETYNYKQAKFENSKSDAYNNVASMFIPYEMLWFKDWVLDSKFVDYNKGFIADDNEEAVETISPTYYENDDFYRVCEVEITQLLNDFWQWSKENKVGLGEKKNVKTFKARVKSFNLKNLETGQDSVTRRSTFKFRPCDIMLHLIEKNAFSDDVTKWKKRDTDGAFKTQDSQGLEFLDLL